MAEPAPAAPTTANPPSAPPLLDISTLITRPKVSIDGVLYELRHPHELSITQSMGMAKLADRASAIQRANAAGEDGDAAALEEVIDAIVREVLLDVPEAVWADLSGSHKLAVAEVFCGLLLRTRLLAAGAIEQALAAPTTTPTPTLAAGAPSTGAKTFPASSGSSAEPRWLGWPKRLWR